VTDPKRASSWYADPTGRHQYRYWDGTHWTDRVADDQVVGTDPPTMDAPAREQAAPTITPPIAPAPAAPPAPPSEPEPHASANTPAAPSAAAAAAAATSVRRAPASLVRVRPAFGVIVALGGAALVIGSFLPAASASARSGPFGVSVERNYLDGDGPVTLILGIGIIAIAALVLARAAPRWVGWVVALLGAVGTLVAVADLVDVQDSIDRIEAIGGSASIGPALWVCLGGGIVATTGGVLTAVARRNRAPAS
jgi:hypothetical protein